MPISASDPENHRARHRHACDRAADASALIEQRASADNDESAELNQEWLRANGILMVNLMGAPGSGKTALLERTLTESDVRGGVIEGDQETPPESGRSHGTGSNVVRINTGAGCHLDARMLAGGLRQLRPEPDSVVFVENIGNLVCPALFALGERYRIVIATVTGSEDEPLRYPSMFRTADLVLLNKIDLLPHLDFDIRRFADNARSVHPRLRLLPVSAATGDGLSDWYDWIRLHVGPLNPDLDR